MNWLGLVRSLHTRYRSKPAHERPVYRLIHRHRCCRLVELGIGPAERAPRMIQVASHRHGGAVHYTGIDLFEGRDRSDREDRLSLKQVHRQLAGTAAHVQLVPGAPFDALARVANSHTDTDFLLIGFPFAADGLRDAWFYVPRMLHPGSLVLLERPGEDDAPPSWERLELTRVQELAEAARRRRPRAA